MSQYLTLLIYAPDPCTAAAAATTITFTVHIKLIRLLSIFDLMLLSLTRSLSYSSRQASFQHFTRAHLARSLCDVH